MQSNNKPKIKTSHIDYFGVLSVVLGVLIGGGCMLYGLAVKNFDAIIFASALIFIMVGIGVLCKSESIKQQGLLRTLQQNDEIIESLNAQNAMLMSIMADAQDSLTDEEISGHV